MERNDYDETKYFQGTKYYFRGNKILFRGNEIIFNYFYLFFSLHVPVPSGAIRHNDSKYDIMAATLFIKSIPTLNQDSHTLNNAAFRKEFSYLIWNCKSFNITLNE